MPATNDFEFRRGEDIEIDWTIRTGESSSDPAVDITAWTLSFKVKRHDYDADPSLTPTASSTVISGPSGTARTTIAAADLTALDGTYRCSLWRTDSGANSCLSEGFFSVLDTVQN